MKDTITIKRGGHSASPLKGKTTIELRDAITNEIVYQKEEHNLVTNYFQAIYDKEIAGGLSNVPGTIISLVKGVQLLNHDEVEDPSNINLEVAGHDVTGFGNLAVNATQTNTKWMSINLLESGMTERGYKWVWDANPNQCNGYISCISLIGKNLSETEMSGDSRADYLANHYWGGKYSVEGTTPMYIGKLVDSAENATVTNLHSGDFSNVVHIDWENEVLIDLERDLVDDHKIIIKRYNLNKNHICTNYRAKPIFIDEHTVSLTNSLNFNYTNGNTVYCRTFSAKVEGNILYLVKGGATNFTATTNLLRVIKINLTDFTHTDELKTLPQTFLDKYIGNFDSTISNSFVYFMKDFYPILDGYVYLTRPDTNKQILKVNLDDVSDITAIQFDNVFSVSPSFLSTNFVTDKYVIFGDVTKPNGTSNPTRLYLDLKNEKTSYTTVNIRRYMINATTGKYVNDYGATSAIPPSLFQDISDGIITTVNIIRNTNGPYDGMLYLEQCYSEAVMLTINNVTPVTKTSDKTMRVIYEISDAE